MFWLSFHIKIGGTLLLTVQAHFERHNGNKTWEVLSWAGGCLQTAKAARHKKVHSEAGYLSALIRFKERQPITREVDPMPEAFGVDDLLECGQFFSALCV